MSPPHPNDPPVPSGGGGGGGDGSAADDDDRHHNEDLPPPAEMVISGGGIVGLVLALALLKHAGVTAEVYERADAFHEDVGAAMGMYPNGLRVLRDISPSLLRSVREAGCPYLYRRWERHDGTEVARAEEGALCGGDAELQSLGIRRWRLQKVLHDAVLGAGIPVRFGKRAVGIDTDRDDGLVEVRFGDGAYRLTRSLFGCDGSRSTVRELCFGSDHRLTYTGVTCLMGMSGVPRSDRGICFPSSSTTGCHGVFFPTGLDEQCFQFHFPIPAEVADEGSWGTLSNEVGRRECRVLARRLREDGWDDKYVRPLAGVRKAVRIGFCALRPGLDRWSCGPGRRVVLLGDAAHPPVPYIGQGAQMGIEDAGVLAMLLGGLCGGEGGDGTYEPSNFGRAVRIYERMRIPRTSDILDRSRGMGTMQHRRSVCERYNEMKEELIRRDVFFHETMPVLLPGAGYDYREDVLRVLGGERAPLSALKEEEQRQEQQDDGDGEIVHVASAVIKA